MEPDLPLALTDRSPLAPGTAASMYSEI